jgi:protein tyrosine/serine phosphatase
MTLYCGSYLSLDTYWPFLKGFAIAFSEILFSASHYQNKARPFARILEHLSSETLPPPTLPMLIHCDLGKDRTGVICALILSLCGVSDEDVAKEYHHTDVELASHQKELVRTLMRNPAFQGTSEDAEILVSSRWVVSFIYIAIALYGL